MDTTIIQKAPVPSVSFLTIATVVYAAVAAKMRAMIDAQVPEGYQDESGFHFGTPTIKH